MMSTTLSSNLLENLYRPYSPTSLITALTYLFHQTQLANPHFSAERALILSGFCPRHHIHIGKDGEPEVDEFVHEQVCALLNNNAAVSQALYEMLIQFGALLNNELATILIRGIRSVHDWQTICQNLTNPANPRTPTPPCEH